MSSQAGTGSDPGTPHPLSPRARLYDRLPVTDDVGWWCQLAAASPDGRVLELGAGTGRLTRLMAAHAQVTAVDRDASAIGVLSRRLAESGHQVVTAVDDVTTMDRGEQFGLVALPAALLNEIPSLAGRRATVRAAATHCRRDGRVAFALLNPLWLLAGGASGGTIEGREGERVRVRATHQVVDLWHQRVHARLSYRFAHGDHVDDQVDAAAVFPVELELLLDAVGLQVEQVWGARPGHCAPAPEDGTWHVLARPVGAS